MSNMMKTMGVYQVLQKKFKLMPFEGVWEKTFGIPETGFKAIIFGNSGQGKTRFCVKFAKYLTNFGKVAYASREEGLSRTLQKAFEAENLIEVNKKLILCYLFNFEGLVKFLSKRGSPDAMILDSIDYMNLTFPQFQQLCDMFPKKTIIFISWAAGKKPKTQAAKDIEFKVDIKLFVHGYVAFPRSRFGGNEPFIIWEEQARLHHPVLFGEKKKRKPYKKRKPKEQKATEVITEIESNE